MRTLWVSLIVMTATTLALPAQTANDPNASAGDFFIISSVDLSKRQILLKLPTEVTELMRVDGDTRFYDEGGKPMRLAGLRAGDTVYITSKPNSLPISAVIVRKGPMTLEVLRQRYLVKK